MKKVDRPTQLGLFVESGRGEEESQVSLINAHLNPIEVDSKALRSQLLSWGAKHHFPAFSFPYVYPGDDQEKRWGLLWSGELSWRRNIANPNQDDRYPGEWLEKAMEQIKRYDSGVNDIPEQITRIADERE
jgi:hypothetical protein